MSKTQEAIDCKGVGGVPLKRGESQWDKHLTPKTTCVQEAGVEEPRREWSEKQRCSRTSAGMSTVADVPVHFKTLIPRS